MLTKTVSIRGKISLLIVLITFFVLSIGFTFVTINNIDVFKTELRQNTKKNAKIIGEYLIVPLMFDDKVEAEHILSGFQNMPYIISAKLYDKNFKPFALYKNSDYEQIGEYINKPERYSDVYERDRYYYLGEILRNAELYGYVHLVVSTDQLQKKINNNLRLFVLLTFILIVLAYILANILQKSISDPILNLVQVMAEIDRIEDYKQRITRVSNDEIGLLYDSFNKMLSRIELSQHDIHHLRNYLSNIIDSMPSILIGVDINGNVTQWNLHAQRYTGLLENDVIGRSVTEIFPRLSVSLEQIIDSIKKREAISDIKQSFVKENTKCYENITIYPLVANGVDGAVIRIDDITDQVRLEEMMIQSEKMLSVGGLAAGMAHEINNPLAGMMQNAQVLIRRLENNSRANLEAAAQAGVTMEGIREFFKLRRFDMQLTMIYESGKRAAKVVQNMLSFARKSEALPQAERLEKLVDETLMLAENDYSLKKRYDFKTIKIMREYDMRVPSVFCEASKIEQVLLNLFKNGSEAMAESREQNGQPERPCFVLRTYMDNDMAVIEVEDNGPGIPDDIKNRIFEPFFTTKRPGKGTGLGLSVSYFIITENHNGEMSVESELGKGTKFIIKLPLQRSANVKIKKSTSD